MGDMLARAGGHYAFRQLTVLPVLLVLSLGTALADTERQSSGSPAQWVAIAALAGFGSWLTFSVCELLSFLVPKASPRARGIAAIAVYGVIEVVRAVLVAGVALRVGALESTDWGFRVVAGGLTGATLYTIWGIVLNDGWAYRSHLSGLIATQRQLQVAVESRHSDVETRLDEMAGSVREAIREALHAVSSSTTATEASARQTVVELMRISDEVVRPIAHRLYRDVERPEPFPAGRPGRVPLTDVLRRIPHVKPFRPEAAISISVMLMIGEVVFAANPAVGTANLLAGLCAAYIVLFAARAWVAPRLARLSVRKAWAAYVAFVAAISASFGVWMTVGDSTAAMSNPELRALYGFTLGTLLLILLALPPALAAAREHVLQELVEANRRLAWVNARLGAELASNRNMIARTLHRDVQGVLVAAAGRLENALAQGIDIEGASGEVRELVDMASRFVVSPRPLPLFSVLLDELQSMWAGVLELSVTLGEGTLDRLDADPVARRSLISILGECCVDSVKHGSATRLDVQLSLSATDALLLECRNNGTPLRETNGAPGLGSAMIRSQTMAFSRFAVADGVAIRAELPLLPE